MKNTKSKIIIMMCAVLCIMAVGYAAFSTVLTITGTANIASEWKIVFTNITQVSKTDGVNVKSTPSASGTTATFDVGLTSPGDKIVYKITLANQGTIDAVIKNIQASATDSPAIIFTVEGVNIGDELKNKTSKDFTVTIEYDPHVTSQPDKLQKTLTVSIITEQKINQSIDPSTPNVNQPTYLRSEILKNNIAYADNVRSPYVDSDTGIDFSKSHATSLGYSEVHETVTSEVDFSKYSYYRFSTDYTFSSTTGVYTMTTDLDHYIWSDLSNSYNDYYTCGAPEGSSCTTLYKMSGYKSETAGVGYKYTSQQSCLADNGKGLYVTSTNTENNQPTYYFRGDVDNNYVKFGTYSTDVYVGGDIWDGKTFNSLSACQNEYSNCTEIISAGDPILWRIVRINEDGSVRMITQDTVGASPYGENYNDNAYFGYMYGTIGATGDDAYNLTHTNTNDGAIKQYIDDWYEDNLSSYTSYLADAGFCNDRSIYSGLGYGTNQTAYGASNRLTSEYKPQFACPNEKRDLFTTNISTKGNKALTYPIGLITADEGSYAASGYNLNNSCDSYLKEGLGIIPEAWTMTPYRYAHDIWPFSIVDNGNVEIDFITNILGVRPVINLKSTVEITSGDGTSTNPYIIK